MTGETINAELCRRGDIRVLHQLPLLPVGNGFSLRVKGKIFASVREQWVPQPYFPFPRWLESGFCHETISKT